MLKHRKTLALNERNNGTFESQSRCGVYPERKNVSPQKWSDFGNSKKRDICFDKAGGAADKKRILLCLIKRNCSRYSKSSRKNELPSYAASFRKLKVVACFISGP